MVGIEVQEIAVPASGGNAQDILQGLLVVGAGRQRFDLSRSQSGRFAILMTSFSSQPLTYHLDGRISEVDELWENLAVFAGSIQLCGIPQGQNGADELSKAFSPSPVGIRLALYSRGC